MSPATAIATLSGKTLDFLQPDPESINLDDLAAGLARHPRYTGQTTRRYSVAQHSLLVAHLAPPEHKLAALMHDAPEAFLCDVASPAKEAMRIIARMAGHQSPYDVLERGLYKAIARHFGMEPDIPQPVLDADFLAMCVEAPYLQPDGWRQPLWDFARGAKPPISAVNTLLHVLNFEDGGKSMWMVEVAGAVRR